MYGIVDSPMVGRGDSARRRGVHPSPTGPSEPDDGDRRDVQSGELAMDVRCVLVKPMASLGGLSMLMLSRSNVSILDLSRDLVLSTLCACSCISLNAQLMSSSDEFRRECRGFHGPLVNGLPRGLSSSEPSRT
jgi:hypothetical protein